MGLRTKGLHGLSMVGLVFLLSGGAWVAIGRPAIAAALIALGIALICAGVAATRKPGALSDDRKTPP
jgi:hypothetical protein